MLLTTPAPLSRGGGGGDGESSSLATPLAPERRLLGTQVRPKMLYIQLKTKIRGTCEKLHDTVIVCWVLTVCSLVYRTQKTGSFMLGTVYPLTQAGRLNRTTGQPTVNAFLLLFCQLCYLLTPIPSRCHRCMTSA